MVRSSRSLGRNVSLGVQMTEQRRLIGVDFGSAALKAASLVPSSNAVPKLVTLSQQDAFFPAIVEVDGNDRVIAAGTAAERSMGAPSKRVVADFRDRLVAPGSRVVVEGQTVDGTKIQAALFKRLGPQLAKRFGHFDGVVVSAPDHWPLAAWSLPQCLAQAGWRSLALAREWACVLAVHQPVSAQDVLLLSAGMGPMRATVCTLQNSTWRAVATQTLDGFSGHELLDHFLSRLCDDVVRETRKDPRNNRTAYTALRNALHQAFRNLSTAESTSVSATLFGQPFRRNVSRDDLVSALEPRRDELSRRVGALRKRSPGSGSCPLMVWGALARILPFAEWTGRGAAGDDDAPLSLAAIAEGAAQIGASFPGRGEWEAGTRFDLRTGKLCEFGSESDSSVLLVDSVPEAEPPPKLAPPAGVLVHKSDGKRIPITRDLLCLGRADDSGVRFSFPAFDMVSVRHAEINHVAGSYEIVDCSSLNGTFVNGRLIDHPQRLTPGDVIRLGRQGPELVFEIET